MEYRGFHLQHQLQEEYTATSVNPAHYKPFTPQAWNSSNNIYCSSNVNGYINSRDIGQGFDFETQQIHRESVARIEDEECCVNDSVIFSSISEGELHFSQSQTDNLYSHVQSWKPILRDGERGVALSKRYYNLGGASSSSSSSSPSSSSSLNHLSTTLGTIMPPSLLSSSSDLALNSQMLLGGSGSTATNTIGLLQLYDSFGLNEHQDHSICSSHCNNLQHHPENSPSNSSNQGSSFISGVSRTKTPRKPKGLSEINPNKKSRPSCSPLQVRKEKLGDRIQTLQKLVAPFGKTNTASVLTEAIGYIHFLHDQIQTLSVPYMKSSQTRPFRMVQLDSKEEDTRKFNYKPDLRSRGLCLVPISYASYIRNFD